MYNKFCFLFFFLTARAFFSQTIIYVDSAATGLNNGSSWNNAFVLLQSALETASPGTDIYVSKGTYYPTKLINDVSPSLAYSRSVSFKMRPNVRLYGGFSALNGATSFSQRNANLFSTILSGDIGLQGVSNDNAFVVILNSYNQLTNASVLDGFVVTKGFYNPGTIQWPTQTAAVGGMLNIGSSPAIFSCTFTNNYACDSLGSNVFAAGALAISNTSTSVNNCEFSNNVARVIVNLNNVADCFGAVAATSGTISNCTFSNNTSLVMYTNPYIVNSYGAMKCFGLTQNCLFVSNTASAIGTSTALFNPIAVGALSVAGALSNCTFSNNSAFVTDGIGVGAVYSHNTTTITGSLFIKNKTKSLSFNPSNTNAPAMSSGAFFSVKYTSLIQAINNSTFTSNSSEGGNFSSGAIISVGIKPKITNCLFDLNVSKEAIISAGAMINMSSYSEINSSRFSNNSSLSMYYPGYIGAGAIFNTGAPFFENCSVESNSTIVNHSRYNSENFYSAIVNLVADAAFNGVKVHHNSVIVNDSLIKNTSGVSGGMLSISSDPILNRCEIYNNKAIASDSLVYCAGGLLAFYNLNNFIHMTINNTLIRNNSATTGSNAIVSNSAGGVLVKSGYGLFQNCTIAGNTAFAQGTASLKSAGGVFLENSWSKINNSLVWGNITNTISGQYSNAFVNITTTNPSPQVVYSDIEGGYSGTGNINSDPLFYDTLYHIPACSPAHNAGLNNTSLPIDLDSNNRIIGGTIDMGVYEVTWGNSLSSSSSETICLGQPALLKAGTPFAKWYLNNNYGGFIIENDTLFTGHTAIGTYSYFVTDSFPHCNRSSIIPIHISIRALPQVHATPSSTNICIGKWVSLKATGANYYIWNGSVGGATNVVNPQTTTVYTVVGTDNYGCKSSATIVVRVNNPQVTIIPTRTVICAGESVTLFASGANTYTWDNSSNSTSITVSPPTYTIYGLKGIDTLGCAKTSYLIMDVLGCLGLEESNDFTKIGVTVFPNPNFGQFYIRSSAGNLLQVYDVLGKKVVEINMENDLFEFKGDLKSGAYQMRITDRLTGKITSRTVIINER